MANTKTPLIQNCNRNPKYLEEIPLNRNSGEKVSTPLPQGSVPNLGKLGKRLRQRKDLFRQRRWIVDFEFLIAMAGIVVMIVNVELYFSVSYNSLASFILEIVISVTSVLLVILVFFYHWTGIRIYMLDNGVSNWRLAYTGWTVSKTIAEAIICSIQPVPYYTNQINGLNSTNSSLKTIVVLTSNLKESHNREVPMNVILSLMMLLRFYLVGRLAVVHSNILIDSALHSFSALSKVTINFQFVFRALMSTHPAWVLNLIMLTTLICASWAMHTCEKFTNKNDQSSAFQSMWMIAITFLTVGYGDLVPVSTCGRFISVVTGLAGVGIVALWVAVLASKLEQTRPEKYIYSFIRRVRLEQSRKNAAADVMKQAVKLWKLRKNGYPEADPAMIFHRRKYLRAVRVMREAAVMDTQIKESSIGMAELYISLKELYTLNKESFYFQKNTLQRIIAIEKSIHELSSQIDDLKKNNINLNRTP